MGVTSSYINIVAQPKCCTELKRLEHRKIRVMSIKPLNIANQPERANAWFSCNHVDVAFENAQFGVEQGLSSSSAWHRHGRKGHTGSFGSLQKVYQLLGSMYLILKHEE